MAFEGSNEERYKRAMQLVNEAKLVIAEMSAPSTGQGMELQEAVKPEIPIIVVAKTGSKISGVLLGTNKVKAVIYYDDIEIMKAKLEKELS